MNTTILALPTNAPGGMDASLSPHFGQCETYTIIELSDHAIEKVTAIPNPPHTHGGCMAPVRLLAEHGVKNFVAGGMGRNPLMGFKQLGINVYLSGDCSSVRQAISAFSAKTLSPFELDAVCGGHGGHGGGEGGCH